MTDHSRPSVHRNRLPKYAVLLLVLCLLIVFAPAATATGSRVLVEVLFDAVIIAGAYSVTRNDARWRPFLALTVMTFLARWSALLWGGVELEIIAAALTAAWMALVVTIVLSELFGTRGATDGAITKSIVAYLLVAVVFASVYEVIELSSPGSFSGVPSASASDALGDAFLYFSLVTLTTLGFGDIVPVSSLIRPLVALEGAVGTLYIAVIIARLVALHVSSGNSGDNRSKSDLAPAHSTGD
ncbi:MAG: potassium channel family protein [Methyloceanibacter sp.]|nr:potassium channel family protein [Methyloceanibacter sp.]